MQMNQVLATIIKIAFYLGVTGTLVDTTIAIRNNAIEAHKIGLISLGQLSRALNGPSKTK